MSLHELTACIYYKLAIERGARGCFPDEEFYQHLTPQALEDLSTHKDKKNDWKPEHDETDPKIVCEDISSEDLDAILK
jgi:hypothetical protein